MLKKIPSGLCITILIFGLWVTPAPFNPYFHRVDFTVPPDPSSIVEKSKEHQDAWEHALQQCTPIDKYTILDDRDCLDALGKYFLNEPVWSYSTLHYYDRTKGLQPIPVRMINSRARILPYSYADYMAPDIPYWRDILDGRLPYRQSLFHKVIREPKCMEISTQHRSGMHEDLAQQCSAREMYKYATYLDACEVASQRVVVLINPPNPLVVRGVDKAIFYQVALEVIAEKIADSTQRDTAKQHLEKGYLHAFWVMSHCMEQGYSVLPNIETNDIKSNDARVLRGPGFWTSSRDQAYQRVNRTHDVLLKIAAKSGDSWAVQSFPLGIFTSSEFNTEVQDRFPLLMHRHFGSPTGWFRSEISLKEQAQHRAKAFLMLKDTFGEQNAQMEYDPVELENEIEYLLDGNALSYPRPLKDILEARALRFENVEDRLLEESGLKIP